MNSEFWNEQAGDDEMAFLTFPDNPSSSRPAQPQAAAPQPPRPGDEAMSGGTMSSFSPQVFENNSGAQLEQQRALPSQPPTQSPFEASAPTPTPPPQQYQQPRPVPSHNNSPNASTPQQRQMQIQMQQQHNFMCLLEEFMNRNNTPLTERYPVIGGKKMNLFLIYAVMVKFGGFNNVLRSKKIVPVASKFGIPPDNNQLLREFVQMYHKCLLPFELYANTPEGMKELSMRKKQLEQQMQFKQATPTSASHQTPPVFNETKFTPGDQRASEPSPATVESRHATPQQDANFVPDFIRNYVPHQRLLDKVGGHDLKALSAFGEQIDHLKPVFLFVPELGKIDLNALTLSLLSKIDAEVNLALNVLLIVTSDPNLVVPLGECMGLLEALASVGTDTLDMLVSGNLDKRRDRYEDARPEYFKPNKIEEVFEKYSGRLKADKDVEVVVDSFTSKEVGDESQDLEVEESDADVVFEEPPRVDTPASDVDEKPLAPFALPSYVELLEAARAEADDFSGRVYAKTFLDRRLMLVEELNTVSMILRNLSFVNNPHGVSNNNLMAANSSLLNFIYALIAALGTSEGFVFARKKMHLMKDTLMTLANVSHAIELRSTKEAFLVLALCLAFGVPLEPEDEKAGFYVPKFDAGKGKYQLHAIDVLTKVLCGSLNNKKMLSSVLARENLDPEMNSLMQTYDQAKNGDLVVRTMGFFVSALPLHVIYEGIERFNDKLPSCLELLLGSIFVAEVIEDAQFSRNVALRLLSSPELVGTNLFKLAFIFAAIYAKTNHENKLMYIHISGKSMELVNVLLRAAVAHAISAGARDELQTLFSVSKLFPADESILGALMTPSLPPDISVQAVESAKLLVRLQEALSN
ncbi:hypothetical protein KL942_005289 [Ogataea angusta]|uniref:ARID domain-containing protein n=1 Tax=Pichia angusta TaxID=870730 RepID=A0ABQ7RPP4_PICAN|nr:hypothetical protein KL942_005289 [Ogataea angusta]KAG7842749.1 hypothetical protein KL941_004779 [Ogataea angusta]KAG7845547.1 hypothetical protein KL940_005233 [Ogataea angusta]KAG7855042.1 hypothetical protein KL919_004809 [Ogataea angusta]